MGSTAVLGAQSDCASNILLRCSHTDAAGAAKLAQRPTPAQKASTAGRGYERKLAVGEPLANLLAGAAPLSWRLLSLLVTVRIRSPSHGVNAREA
jgi:hypothetical protein